MPSKRAHFCLGVLSWLLFSAIFMADAAKSSADAFTLASTLERAETQAPGVQRANAELAVASAHNAFAEVPVVGNPVIGARAIVGPDSTAATYSLSLGIPIDFSGRRSAWNREASSMIESAAAYVDVARAAARLDAFGAYVEVAAAEARVSNARDRVEAASTFLASTEARMNQGAGTALDVALAQRELALATAAVEETEREADAARERFRHALDLGAVEGIEVEELTRPQMPEGLTIANVTTRALRNRRESAALRAQEARYRAAESRVRRDAIEPVTIAAEGERQGNRSAAYAVGGSLNVPIPLVRTGQGERAVMRSQAEYSVQELALMRRQIEREAASSYRELAHLLRELAIIEDTALPVAEQSVTLSERLLAAGASDVFRVLAARNELYTQRDHRIDVMRRAWRAFAELDHAVGGLDQ